MALLALMATWRSAVRQSICESSVTVKIDADGRTQCLLANRLELLRAARLRPGGVAQRFMKNEPAERRRIDLQLEALCELRPATPPDTEATLFHQNSGLLRMFALPGNVHAVPLAQTVTWLRRLTSVAVIVDPDLALDGHHIDFSLNGEPLRTILDRLPGITWLNFDGAIYLVPRPAGAAKPDPIVPPTQDAPIPAKQDEKAENPF